jgi:hypothetical protein
MAFYTEKLGFALDVDVSPSPGVRVVQLTPPGSACSIVISTGLDELSEMTPGSIKGLHLVVNDIAEAREELLGRGVAVGDLSPVGGGVTYAWISDPDGNTLDPATDGLADRRRLLSRESSRTLSHGPDSRNFSDDGATASPTWMQQIVQVSCEARLA